MSTRSVRVKNINKEKLEKDPDHPLPPFGLVTPKKQKSRPPEDEEDLSLPKQRRSNSDTENIQSTPSTLLKHLSLLSPDTKSGLRSRGSEQYRNARRSLHTSFPTAMPGREEEIQRLSEFIKNCKDRGESGTMYISGSPGTGKTAALTTILQRKQIAGAFKKAFINCTAIKSSGSIYSHIVKDLGISVSKKTGKECLLGIEKFIENSGEMVLLILDEIDQLDSKHQSVLYTIFEWPARQDSKVVLIGISNALDLTDRVLPRLQAHCELQPTLMHFSPYTKDQITRIFTERLQGSDVDNVFAPAAIQLIARKVSAMSGDIRKALDIGRRVMEIAENQHVLQPLQNAAKTQTTINVQQVMHVLNNVYRTSQSIVGDDDEALPLQQKIVLCVLLLMLSKAKSKDVTIGKLHEVYKNVCRVRNLVALDQAEFAGLCSLIETRGIIRVSGKKEPRFHKVALVWNEDEVTETLKDKQLLSAILNEKSSLGTL